MIRLYLVGASMTVEPAAHRGVGHPEHLGKPYLADPVLQTILFQPLNQVFHPMYRIYNTIYSVKCFFCTASVFFRAA